MSSLPPSEQEQFQTTQNLEIEEEYDTTTLTQLLSTFNQEKVISSFSADAKDALKEFELSRKNTYNKLFQYASELKYHEQLLDLDAILIIKMGIFDPEQSVQFCAMLALERMCYFDPRCAKAILDDSALINFIINKKSTNFEVFFCFFSWFFFFNTNPKNHCN